MVASAIIAWGVGRICIRLRSDYLAIATLGIAEIFRLVLKNEIWATNGARGISRIPKPFEHLPEPWNQVGMLLLVFAIVLALYVLLERARPLPLGAGDGRHSGKTRTRHAPPARTWRGFGSKHSFSAAPSWASAAPSWPTTSSSSRPTRPSRCPPRSWSGVMLVIGGRREQPRGDPRCGPGLGDLVDDGNSDRPTAGGVGAQVRLPQDLSHRLGTANHSAEVSWWNLSRASIADLSIVYHAACKPLAKEEVPQ